MQNWHLCKQKPQLMLWCLIGGNSHFQIVIFKHSSGSARQSWLEGCRLKAPGQENIIWNADEMR